MKEPKVLVGASINSKKHFLIPLFIKGLRGLTYKNKDLLLVDNSREAKLFDLMKGVKGIKVEKTEFIENDEEAIIRDRKLMMKKAIEGNYDYLFSLGLGIVPPADAIERLMGHKKDACSAVFFTHALQRTGNEDGFDIIHRIPVPSLGMLLKKGEKDLQLQKCKFPEVFPSRLMQVDVASLNCMLISKDTLKKIDFAHKEKISEDLLFALKCRDKKVKIYADTSVVCAYWEKLILGFYEYKV